MELNAIRTVMLTALGHSRGCCRQFVVLVLFRFYRGGGNRRLVMVLVRWALAPYDLGLGEYGHVWARVGYACPNSCNFFLMYPGMEILTYLFA
jgi:hypothetical protein